MLINEGQYNTATPNMSLTFPNIDSCLAITTVLPQTTRVGGHAILIPDNGQGTLQDICDYINTRPYGDTIFIIGDIAAWNQNWQFLPQCQNLIINGQNVNNVLGIAAALGYAPQNTIIQDTDLLGGGGTFDVHFGFRNNQRSLWLVQHRTNRNFQILGHPTW